MSESEQPAISGDQLLAVLADLGIGDTRRVSVDAPIIEALCLAHQQLEEGEPGLAMNTLESELAEPEGPQTLEMGAAAFVLRGRAHEAQGRPYNAKLDYEMALNLNPTHPSATEALSRLNRPTSN